MTAWLDAAACRGENTNLFFPIGHGPDMAPQIEKAKAICRRCPVRTDCLRTAVNRPEKYGIWGGVEENDRNALRRNDRRRVRPQFSEKEEVA